METDMTEPTRLWKLIYARRRKRILRTLADVADILIDEGHVDAAYLGLAAKKISLEIYLAHPLRFVGSEGNAVLVIEADVPSSRNGVEVEGGLYRHGILLRPRYGAPTAWQDTITNVEEFRETLSIFYDGLNEEYIPFMEEDVIEAKILPFPKIFRQSL